MIDEKEMIEDIILGELAANRSVLIDGIATISLRRVGSRVVNPKVATDFPHIELVVAPPSDGLSLCDRVGEERFNEWITSVKGVKSGASIFNIKDCFTLKIKGGKIEVLSVETELKMILNPFATEKNDKKRCGKSWIVILLSIFVLSLAGYFMYSGLPKFSVEKTEKEAVLELHSQVIADSIAAVIRAEAIADSLAQLALADTVDFFVVVGSYPSKYLANKDSLRLMGIYGDMDVRTFRKRDGKTINYIYKASSQKEAESVLAIKVREYPIIKGMWVYEQRK